MVNVVLLASLHCITYWCAPLTSSGPFACMSVCGQNLFGPAEAEPFCTLIAPV